MGVVDGTGQPALACHQVVDTTDVPIDIADWMFDDVALLPVNMLQRRESARRVVAELSGQLARGELNLRVNALPMSQDTPVFDLLARGLIDGRACLSLVS